MVKIDVFKFEIFRDLLGVRIVAALRRASCIKKWSIGGCRIPGTGQKGPFFDVLRLGGGRKKVIFLLTIRLPRFCPENREKSRVAFH